MIMTFNRCHLDRVIDGDSLVLNVDTGFNHSAKVHVRLQGVDTPERGNPEGWRLARGYVENWLAKAESLSFVCTGPDKFGGRWLGKLYNPMGESLSDALIQAGLGVPYSGGKRT